MCSVGRVLFHEVAQVCRGFPQSVAPPARGSRDLTTSSVRTPSPFTCTIYGASSPMPERRLKSIAYVASAICPSNRRFNEIPFFLAADAFGDPPRGPVSVATTVA
jgi:hypothetical protein